MMKKVKKLYIAPAAELILLVPLEAIAETNNDNNLAMNKWGQKVVENASIVGSKQTMWLEDGTIIKTQ